MLVKASGDLNGEDTFGGVASVYGRLSPAIGFVATLLKRDGGDYRDGAGKTVTPTAFESERGYAKLDGTFAHHRCPASSLTTPPGFTMMPNWTPVLLEISITWSIVNVGVRWQWRSRNGNPPSGAASRPRGNGMAVNSPPAMLALFRNALRSMALRRSY